MMMDTHINFKHAEVETLRSFVLPDDRLRSGVASLALPAEPPKGRRGASAVEFNSLSNSPHPMVQRIHLSIPTILHQLVLTHQIDLLLRQWIVKICRLKSLSQI
jgi:hypothetical protein